MKNYKLDFLSFLIFGIFGYLSLIILIKNPHYVGDTGTLLQGTLSIQNCLEKGVVTNCSQLGEPTGAFPIFQYIPALLLAKLNFIETTKLKFLSLLNGIFYIGSLLLTYWGLKKTTSHSVAVLGILVMITSPLLHYGRATFNEPASIFIILLFVFSLITRQSIFVLIFLSTLVILNKEINVPFVILSSFLCLYPDLTNKKKQFFTKYISVIIGLIIGVLLSFLFNYFRYGNIRNVDYTHSASVITSSYSQVVSNFLGLWFSPNGGILFFWFSLFISIVTISISIFLNRRQYNFSKLIPLLIIIASLFLLTLGLALWWSPFGWYAWGPRLMLPWLPAYFVLLLFFYKKQVCELLLWIFDKKGKTTILCLFLCIFAAPNLAVVLFPQMETMLFTLDSVCPSIPYPTNPEYYNACMNHYMWTKTPVPLYSVEVMSLNLNNFLHYLFFWMTICFLIYWLAKLVYQENKVDLISLSQE